jgi:hypothetical protein
MAKISYQDIPLGLEEAYKKNILFNDRFVIPSVRVKKLISRRKVNTKITQKSLFFDIVLLWNSYSDAQKNLWNQAGNVCGMTGYRCFIREYTLRRQYNLDVNIPPNIYHQGKFGKIVIYSGDNNFQIQQDHPLYYYILKKVRNSKDQYEPKQVIELVSFPFIFKINYKSNLTFLNSDSYAKLKVFYVSNYQGRDIETIKEIVFDSVSDWTSKELNIIGIFGKFRYYRVELDFKNVSGEFYFDNFKILHSGKNWARDTQCNDINEGFTKAFYQVSKNWIADIIGENSNFESVFE